MKQKWRKYRILLIAVIMLTAALTGCGREDPAPKEPSTTESDVQATPGLGFELNSDQASYVLVSKGMADGTDIVIPSVYEGLPVTKIDYRAFMGDTTLTSVVISEGVTEIGFWAFRGCSSLRSISIPSTVMSIESDAFLGCHQLIEIEDEMEYVDGWLIRCYNGVTQPRIREGTVGIAARAFEMNPKLERAVIPASVRAIGHGAFLDSEALTEVIFSEGSQLTLIDSNAFSRCTRLAELSLPQSVQTVGSNAFTGCDGLTEVILPQDLRFLEEMAFSGCDNLALVVLPEGLVKIGRHAFLGCERITELILPKSLKIIENDAFAGTKLKRIDILSGVTVIQGNPFAQCEELAEINVSASNPAFCSVDGVIYTKDMTKLLHYPAAKEEKELILPNGVISIGESAFLRNRHVERVTLPTGLRCIEYRAFYDGALREITIPKTVTVIKDYAFCGNQNLRSVVFAEGSELEVVGRSAFYGCSLLSECRIPAGVKKICVGAFGSYEVEIRLIFEDPTGWYLHEYTGRIFPISKEDLSDPLKAGRIVRNLRQMDYEADVLIHGEVAKE